MDGFFKTISKRETAVSLCTEPVKLFHGLLLPAVELACNGDPVGVGSEGTHNTIVNQVCTKVFIGIKDFAHIEFLKIHKTSFPTHLCLIGFCGIIAYGNNKFQPFGCS